MPFNKESYANFSACIAQAGKDVGRIQQCQQHFNNPNKGTGNNRSDRTEGMNLNKPKNY